MYLENEVSRSWIVGIPISPSSCNLECALLVSENKGKREPDVLTGYELNHG